MKVIEMKMTLQRSNPSLIRQFTVPADYTLLQLHKIIHILLAWKQLSIYQFLDGEKQISSNQKIGTLEHTTILYQCTGSEVWKFRLQILGTKEQEAFHPRVIRYQGENPPKSCENIQVWNQLQNFWLHNGYGYYSTFYRENPISKYKFSLVQANRMLQKEFGSPTERKLAERFMKFDYRKAVPISEVLEDYRITDLKKIAQRLHMTIPSNIRKNDLVNNMSEQFGTEEVLSKVLACLSQKEYELFQKICQGKCKWGESREENEILYKMSQFGYVGEPGYYSYDAIYTKEMLYAYEAWLEKNDEKQYIQEAKRRTILSGGTIF